MALPDNTLPRILAPVGRALSRAALPPLSAQAVTPIGRGRPNYILNVALQTGRIRGTVQHKELPANAPAHRRVRLYRSRDGLLVAQQWSNAVTGEYDFQYVENDQVYTVIADDYAGNWRAVVADQLKPELMP